tara:strand:+ start:7771 stop:11439 length:3669 start_codon:yes stop_codon:yes gene_type:complete
MSLEDHVNNREWLMGRIRAEVVGPDPSGDAIIPVGVATLPDCTWPEFRKPRKQVNGEEVLWQDSPLKRYGAGILYPAGSRLTETESGTGTEEGALLVDDPQQDHVVENADESFLSRDISNADETEDYDVSLANAMSPSAIGLSFLADLSKMNDDIIVELVNVGRTTSDKTLETASATYRRAPVSVRDDKGNVSERVVWLRAPLKDSEGAFPKVTVYNSEISEEKIRPIRKPVPGVDGLEAVIVVRQWKHSDSTHLNYRLLTVTFVNRKNRPGGGDDENSIFQAGIRVSSKSKNGWIVPYPESGSNHSVSPQDPLSDETINKVLYRDHQAYAIGHGCAADWSHSVEGAVSAIWSDVLPVYETPSTTAELEYTDDAGQLAKLRVSMRKLAGLDSDDSGLGEVSRLLSEYERWIQKLRIRELPELDSTLAETGESLIKRCEWCLARIRDGVSLLESEGPMGQLARSAFALANHAMLIAQLRGGAKVRNPDCSTGAPVWKALAEFPDPAIPHDTKGYWRPFQIAFLLMSLRGICEPDHEDRQVVDLIWFPTGGGKTEAYLGVTAFTIFYNRLAGRETTGCDVLMRYTLRLLTAQQFQRAATLFCAMEHLRRSRSHELGDKSFTIGLWVGSNTTPNSRKDALAKLKKLENSPNEENPFVLLQCPWCAAKMGPVEATKPVHGYRGHGKGRKPNQLVLGYVRAGAGNSQTVVYQCPDSACEFSSGSVLSRGKRPLPIATIDEDLIQNPPRLLIGTVDKFAMLAWKPELRSFFGIGPDGKHISAPPSLIIQDELHLISGPLGTMVGAYEMVIDRLCREHGIGDVMPKIIASTATISRAREQIKHLYAREESMLFPPSGLKSSDSFFAREAKGPGRMYLGVMAPAHFSLQTTEARVFATLLQSVAHMPANESSKDPWWTLLCFFNSLRELGSAATLMVADVREYMRVLMDRHGWAYKTMRNSIASELTSRIRGDDIPKELAKLEIPLSAKVMDEPMAHPVDVCLASNVIEVGVDLPRLSLMSVVGQPKSTSQYIQVSSRVGRGKDKPGLVVVLYGQSKPRDRSHYEHFRGYHQKLYAQVEPTSVTPFSAPAIERAIQGVLVSVIRQLGELNHEAESPRPYPRTTNNNLVSVLETMLTERSDIVTDGEATPAVIQLLRERLSEWRAWDPSEYGGFGKFPESPPLMYPAGANPPADWNGHSWPTLSSMRNVDASGEADITDWFNEVSSSEEHQ